MKITNDSTAYFEFDEQLIKLYRNCKYFADSEFNKISLHPHQGFIDFITNHENRHKGFPIDPETGINKVEPHLTVSYNTYINQVLL